MPVASYHQGPHKVGPSQIMAPKVADLRSWWNACRKVFPDLPLYAYYEQCHGITYVDFETIHFSWGNQDVYIARRRNMR